ncbi:hypothetical protein Dvina_13150 [Dactylosporangium vinaceum]|uniref:Uncharacterized protein n=1 Tax=Dactylosporangium vinaceum TaxID=53362 RepID=A0ABV5MGR5_9ACTN|nr:hypothetical protein [Dactylosporangium vinaceum]UAB98937.1 hypothetical protein Dvina_13150 [Dactylosporangium vinaceum]
MGLAREAIRATSMAAAAGLAVGGVFGLIAPAAAEAGSTTPGHREPAALAPAVVTSVDLLGAGPLEVTVRFTNTGRTVEHLTGFDVLADGRPLAHADRPAAVDLHPGATTDETLAFAAPPAAADLVLTLPGGEQLPLEL